MLILNEEYVKENLKPVNEGIGAAVAGAAVGAAVDTVLTHTTRLGGNAGDMNKLITPADIINTVKTELKKLGNIQLKSFSIVVNDNNATFDVVVTKFKSGHSIIGTPTKLDKLVPKGVISQEQLDNFKNTVANFIRKHPKYKPGKKFTWTAMATMI